MCFWSYEGSSCDGSSSHGEAEDTATVTPHADGVHEIMDQTLWDARAVLSWIESFARRATNLTLSIVEAHARVEVEIRSWLLALVSANRSTVFILVASNIIVHVRVRRHIWLSHGYLLFSFIIFDTSVAGPWDANFRSLLACEASIAGRVWFAGALIESFAEIAFLGSLVVVAIDMLTVDMLPVGMLSISMLSVGGRLHITILEGNHLSVSRAHPLISEELLVLAVHDTLAGLKLGKDLALWAHDLALCESEASAGFLVPNEAILTWFGVCVFVTLFLGGNSSNKSEGKVFHLGSDLLFNTV